jgi:hypothetical protein
LPPHVSVLLFVLASSHFTSHMAFHPCLTNLTSLSPLGQPQHPCSLHVCANPTLTTLSPPLPPSPAPYLHTQAAPVLPCPLPRSRWCLPAAGRCCRACGRVSWGGTPHRRRQTCGSASGWLRYSSYTNRSCRWVNVGVKG